MVKTRHNPNHKTTHSNKGLIEEKGFSWYNGLNYKKALLPIMQTDHRSVGTFLFFSLVVKEGRTSQSALPLDFFIISFSF